LLGRVEILDGGILRGDEIASSENPKSLIEILETGEMKMELKKMELKKMELKIPPSTLLLVKYENSYFGEYEEYIATSMAEVVDTFNGMIGVDEEKLTKELKESGIAIIENGSGTTTIMEKK